MYYPSLKATPPSPMAAAKPNSSPTYNPTNPSDGLAIIAKFFRHEDSPISVGPKKSEILQDLALQEKPKVLVEFEGQKNHSLEMDPTCAAIARQLAQITGLDHIIEVIECAIASSIITPVQEGKITNIESSFLDHVEDLYEEDYRIVEAFGVFGKGAMALADDVIKPEALEFRDFRAT
ncbi:hypothetical protein EAF04_003441 [Stromatinia cepivora]|nr:hypothetical protein EAF04_003441 [Stromatinia cepivora]